MSDNNNITDINGHNDAELEALYQQAEKIMPPDHLDATIINAARNKVSRKPAAYPWFGSIAATVVIGLLIIQIYPDMETEQPARSLSEDKDITAQTRPNEMNQPKTVRLAKESAELKKRKQVASRMAEQETLLADAEIETAAKTGIAKPAASPKAAASIDSKTGNINTLNAFSDSLMPVTQTVAGAAPRSKLDASAEGLLSRIEEFIKTGETEKARELLKELKKKYPDFKIKAEITEKLEN